MRLLFAYNHDWHKEVCDYYRGVVPSHRLFGLADVRRLRHQATYCRSPRWLSRLSRKPTYWKLYQALFAVARQRETDAIVATHEAAAVPLLVLRRLGVLRRPIIVLSVALLHPRNCAGIWRRVWRWLLPWADVITTYATAQIDWIRDEFSLPPASRITAIPLGVDTAFFSPRSNGGVKRECLAVGTNEGRDFATLIRALPANVILTAVTDGLNAKVIRQVATAGQKIEILTDIPIGDLREYYATAAVHVIPMFEARFSCGQTVLLENMALGRLVIVSGTSAVLDYVEDGVSALVVPPNDPQAMRGRIESALRTPDHYSAIGPKAAAVVRSRFTSECTARRVLELAQDLAISRTARNGPIRPKPGPAYRGVAGRSSLTGAAR